MVIYIPTFAELKCYYMQMDFMNKVRKIVLSVTAILTMSLFASAQNHEVTGAVTDAAGLPLIGATVAVDGTVTATMTDITGRYTISAPAEATLVVSYIGYIEQSVPVNGKTQVDVVLHEASEAIAEVIVTAFGTAKKEAFTGSAKMIKSDDLARTQSTNVSDALVGKIAGAQMSSSTGRPGSDQTIRIRGFGSVNAGQSPLWVVDGVPYDGDINNINSNDIESISVLKDAASNALYGARGANGVIMVTTKRAKAGDAMVNVDAKWGVNTPALKRYDTVTDPGQHYELHYQSLYNYYRLENGYTDAAAHKAAADLLLSSNPGGLSYNVFTVPTGQNLIGTNGKLNPRATLGRKVSYTDPATGVTEDYWVTADDWVDELLQTSFRQEYNVSVAGATDRSNFYASFGYLDNEGIIDGSSNERYTARLRADYQAKKWLKVGGNFSYTNFTWRNGNGVSSEGDSAGSGNVFADALSTAPIYSLYVRNADGSIRRDKYGFRVYDNGAGVNAGLKRSNPTLSNSLQDIQLNKYVSEGNAFSGNGFVDFDLYKGLKLTVNGGVNIDETRSTTLLNPYYGQFTTNGGSLTKSHMREIAYNLQQLLTYNHTFGFKHNIDLLLGHEMYNTKTYSLSAGKSGLFSYYHDELDGAVEDDGSASSYRTEYNTEGFFFRGQYDYDGRVFASVSYRRDASSKFHPDHRWGNFWSLGAAWLIDREVWFNSAWVDMLKVKASYGSQGNDSISPYLYTDLYYIKNDGSGGVATPFYRRGNENITWETNSNLNLGVEFELFGRRLSGSVDFFNRRTTDMLFSIPLKMSNGYSSVYTNIGDMLNRGIEIELNAGLITTKNVRWDFSLNMTHYKNKLLSLPEEYKRVSVGGHKGYDDGSFFRGEGLSFYTFYLPSYAGLDKDGQSMWYLNEYDEDGNRKTTTSYSVAQNNKDLHGTSIPDLYGGFNTSLQLYGVDFSINFTYQIGGLAYDAGYSTYMSSPYGTSTESVYHKDLFNAWTPENKDSDIPRFVYNDTYSSATSDRFLLDASYLNIQNISLGYTLPQHISRKFFVEKLRIYVVCDNVWYWSRRKGFDPRQSMNGATNMYYYPQVRTISGGLSVTF